MTMIDYLYIGSLTALIWFLVNREARTLPAVILWPFVWLYLVGLLASCVNITRKTVPLPGLLHSIANEEYKLGRNDCSNKAAKYFYAVKAEGYDPTIIVYRTRSGKVHAVVQVGETYIDCTDATATLGRPRDIMYENKEEDFHRFGKEYEVSP